MIALIVYLVCLGLLFWVTTLLPLPDPFPTVIKVVFIIIVIIVLLNFVGVNLNPPHWVHP